MRLLPLRPARAVCALVLPPLLLGACGAGDAPEQARLAATQPGARTAAVLAADGQAGPLPAEDHAAPPTGPAAAHVLAAPGGSMQRAPAAPAAPVETVQLESAPAATGDEAIRLAAAYTPLVAGTIKATPYWPAWYGNGKPVDGVNCLVNGNWHKHALISIYSNGKRLGFADGIGRVHAGCYHAYEMHVHDVTGIVHMEADTPRQFRLGQWFSLWQQPLSRAGTAGLPGPVRFYIIDNATILRYDGDPAQIQLLPHREVLIVSGTPMTVAPKYQWPAGI